MAPKSPTTDNSVKLFFKPATKAKRGKLATPATPAKFTAVVHHGDTFRVRDVQLFTPDDELAPVPDDSADEDHQGLMTLQAELECGSNLVYVYTWDPTIGKLPTGNWRAVAHFVSRCANIKTGFATVK